MTLPPHDDAPEPRDPSEACLAPFEQALDAFIDALGAEARCLRAFDAEAIHEALATKQACAERVLQHSDENRRALVSHWVESGRGLAAMPERLPDLLEQLAQAPEGDAAEARASALRHTAHRLLAREHTILAMQTQNAALAERSLGWIGACFERLQNAGARPSGYDQRGRSRARSAHMFAKQA